MIIGENRESVIKNIKDATVSGDMNVKVETDDPVLTATQRRATFDDFVKKTDSSFFGLKTWCARQIANSVTWGINRETDIIGMHHLNGINGGAIITSNHFSQIDNTIIRKLARQTGRNRLFIVSQGTNLMMKGFFGFLMNYADIIPIGLDHHYLVNHFEPMLKDAVDAGNFVLVYPEEEMWFNYRKPRPLKQGAYYYSAKFGVPIISCFVQITDLFKTDAKGFSKVKYTLHVLAPIYPDKSKTIRENRKIMSMTDYEQKKETYEKAYGKELTYEFEKYDIAGWYNAPGD